MAEEDPCAAWATAVWPALPGEVPAELAAAIVAAWQSASAAHPAIAIPASEWFAYVGDRLPDGIALEAVLAELARRNLADLYLACGCNAADPAALHAFEREVLPEVARRLRFPADQLADVLQILRERMLVATMGARGIAAYDGRAPLAMWLRVVASQIGLRLVARDRRSVALEDHQLDQIAPGVPDPALLYFKRHYGTQFRLAFAEAVDSLAPRERNLLRHAVIDELGIDQIAAIYHVHRATAARQLNQARAALVEATRNRMRVSIGVDVIELDSILRGIMTMTDITLRQVLGRGRGHASEPE
jgi:RNA polymerase sigma-70 factor, ECF subfamily